MSGEKVEDLKPKSLSAKIKAMASSRRIPSSGYGKVHDQPKMFQPRINKRSTSKPTKAWESHDEGFISPTSSLEDLSSESSEHKPRGRWKHPKVKLIWGHINYICWQDFENLRPPPPFHWQIHYIWLACNRWHLGYPLTLLVNEVYGCPLFVKYHTPIGFLLDFTNWSSTLCIFREFNSHIIFQIFFARSRTKKWSVNCAWTKIKIIRLYSFAKNVK